MEGIRRRIDDQPLFLTNDNYGMVYTAGSIASDHDFGVGRETREG
jgi:hypothetical protein